MATPRARQLLDELLRETGVSGVLLPSANGRVTVRLELAFAYQADVEETKGLFGTDRLAVQRPLKRKREEEEEEEKEEEYDKDDDKKPDTDQRLLDIFKHNSGRACFDLRPDVWTQKGKWRREYAHLEGRVVKEAVDVRHRLGINGTVTNRAWVTWFDLNGTQIQAGFVVQQSDNYQRIIIAFTRASSHPPTYGMQGMFDRAGVAAKAWSQLATESSSLILALPRARVASAWPLEETRANTREMKNVLDAAADGITVELLSIGLDGLTTDLQSLSWLQQTWGNRLRLRLVVAVGKSFPGSEGTFPVAANEVRYGVFDLRDISEVLLDPQTPGKANTKELVELISEARELKLENGASARLVDLTSGRANFRVCPDSQFESGVNEVSRQSRSLR
ncbi:hypothetical protein CC79DRAFT_1400246 [Sarocladium strictum]